jgi:hypothetical protein
VLQAEATLEMLRVGGEKGTNGDFAPAMPRKMLGEFEVELRIARAFLEGSAVEGEIDVLENVRLIREWRVESAVSFELKCNIGCDITGTEVGAD